MVLAAEAFTAHYRHLLGGGPHVRSSIPAADLTACSQLLAVLCRLTTGPYGVSRDSLRLAARLTLLAPEVVADYVRLGGPRAQLVRAFERSARHAHWNAQVRQQFATLLARPPEIIDRRLDWLRGLRRLRLTDFASPETQATRRRWLHTQLLFAMRGEKGYAGARATERRYALWVAAEVTLDDASWQDVVTSAAADPLLTGLLPTVDQLRHHLARRAVHHRDAFWFTPSTGWPTLSSSSDVNEILGPYFVTKRTWSQHGTWSWARGATRWMAASLISDAVLAPCAVRQRSATDALVAGGEECREAASTTVAAVLAAERAGTRPHPVIVQRCLHLLGVLRHPAGIDAVQEVLRGLTPTDVAEILPVAITAAGDLAWAHPDDATGLEAWAARRASEHLDDEQVAVDAIRAFVAFRRDPVAELGARLPEGPGTRAALSWAAEVVGDPLGGPPPARSGSR